MLVYTIIIILLAITGALVALYSFMQKSAGKEVESKNSLVDTFNHGKKLNHELIQRMQDYTERYQAYDEHFMEDLTFQKCLTQLKKIKDQFFNEEKEALVKNVNYRKEHSEELNQQIHKLISRHIQISNSLEWYSKG